MKTKIKIIEIVKTMNGGIDLEILLEQKDKKTIDRLYSQIVKNK